MDKKMLHKSIIHDARTEKSEKSIITNNEIPVEDRAKRTKEWVNDHLTHDEENLHEKSISISKGYPKSHKSSNPTFSTVSNFFKSVKNVLTEKPKQKRGRPPKMTRRLPTSKSPSPERSSVNDRIKAREQRLRPKGRIDYRKLAGKKNKLPPPSPKF